jgi:hypothetical protein
MTLLIGESPYYWSDCTRLLFTLIIELFSFAEYPVACCGDKGEENPP